MTNKKIPDQLLDTRVVHRNVHDGFVTQADVDAHLAALPDVAGKGEPLRASHPGQDDVDLDDDTEE